MKQTAVNGHDHAVAESCGLAFAALGHLSDTDLMAHLQAGHHEALAVLFDRFHRLVLSVAYKTLSDVGEAEDILQAVFLEVFERSLQYDPKRGSVKIWLLQLAYHTSRTRRQYLKSRHFYQSANLPRQTAEKTTIPCGSSLPALPEVRRLVQESLKSLSVPQRTTLRLAYFGGLSLREIAEETGESLGNVRNHYYRGLRKLRHLLLDGNGKPQFTPATRGMIDVEA